jgi:hypothetical protein
MAYCILETLLVDVDWCVSYVPLDREDRPLSVMQYFSLGYDEFEGPTVTDDGGSNILDLQ